MTIYFLLKLDSSVKLGKILTDILCLIARNYITMPGVDNISIIQTICCRHFHPLGLFRYIIFTEYSIPGQNCAFQPAGAGEPLKLWT